MRERDNVLAGIVDGVGNANTTIVRSPDAEPYTGAAQHVVEQLSISHHFTSSI
jgi:hypothetical protein